MPLIKYILVLLIGFFLGWYCLKAKAPLCQDSLGLKLNEIVVCKQVGDPVE